jgi:ElaA protein
VLLRGHPIKLNRVPECSIVTKTWSELTTDELYALLKLRTDVFFVEQKVDDTELDDRDQEPTTEHLWIADDAGIASYLRVIQDAEPTHRDARRLFGRVVTRPDARGRGLSQQLIAEVIRRHGHEAMLLHAQTYIVPLYARFGFETFGEEYEEAGIPHFLMYRPALTGEPSAL